ncbi:MAG: restriction endonuclease subunit S [Euryarchaeota archaeon]|nr:restriction endonuclease subunit S [Euryarchaeota archaeon]MBU4607427.1 restriction endonuclease subunit S [Euryarchaeota archaeon]MBV1730131.1 restriction endonuclease subunit S [Methanobacterium sp.]MBV1754062.1 restriction endonuclease subunit S [Methanobacterium sp.]
MTEGKFKETEIGLIPNDWEIKKIKDTCHQVRESFSPNENDNRYYIGLEHINENSLTLNGIGSSLDVKSSKLAFKKGHILFGKLRPYFRKLYRPDFDGVCSTDIFVINGKEGFDNGFLYYFFANPLIIDLATLSSEGTRMPRASWKYLSELEFAFPSLDEQRAISSVLSSFDDKIELNNKMNQTLEEIGQAIFKHWFVHFEFPNEEGKPYKSTGGEMADSDLGEIPKGWEIGKFSDLIFNIKNPLKPGEHLKNRNYVPIDCLSMKKLSISDFQDYSEAKSSLIAFEKGDILLGAMRVYFHRVNLAPFPGITRTTTFVLRPKKEYYLSYSIFLLNQNSSIEYANSHSKGTTMPYAVWENSLADMPILMPSELLVKKYDDISSPLLIKINESVQENQNLKDLRDSLLPKLMSGKIRVSGETK